MNQEDLLKLLEAASLAGFEVPLNNNLQLQVLDSGLDTHFMANLLPNHSATYIFKKENQILKIGHCGVGCNPCFKSRHYGFSFPSTLAKSLMNYQPWNNLYQRGNIGDWIRENTTRYNLYIPESYGNYFRYFAESFFILKYQPLFERKGN